MKKSRIIAPALGVLILSTAASITGTVAWFTANNSVSVTGMTVKTKVSNNIFIAEDTLASTAKKTDAELGTDDIDTQFSDILMPVSTINGTSFYYNSSTNADGHIDEATGAWIAYNASTAATDGTTYLNKFSEDYGLSKTDANTLISGKQGAVGYLDYVFQIKAVNASSDAVALKLTELTVKYSGATDGNVAFRAAVFYEDISSDAPAGGVGDLKTIFAPGASGDINYHAGKAVSSADALATVTYNAANSGTVTTVAARASVQYKAVVRLWLEGEDKTCTSETFAALNGQWAFNLTYHLDNDNNHAPVTQLTMDVTPAQNPQNP